MLKLLDADKFVIQNKLEPVTSPMIFQAETFHPDGIFSERIFGPIGSPERRTEFAYVDLKATVIHPIILKVIKRLDKKLYNMVLLDSVYRFDKDSGKLIEDDQGDLFGFEGLKTVFNDHHYRFRGGSDYREKFIAYIKEHIDKIFITKIILLPAALREVTVEENDPTRIKFIDEVNELYINILNVVQKLSNTQMGSTSHQFINVNLQKAVSALFEYMKIKIAKKEGFIRNLSLGKRVDFSARAVISGDPNVRPDETGVPLRLICKLFEPYFMHHVIKKKFKEDEMEQLEKYVVPKYGSSLNAETVKSYLTSIYKNYVSDVTELTFIMGLFERYITHDKPVILKRDPALHKQGVQGFNIKIHLGHTIKIAPVVCGPFNADFDGDQMAIYTVLSKEAQDEIKEKMIMPKSPETINGDVLATGQGMNVGIYTLTKDARTNMTPIKLPAKFDVEEGLKLSSDKYKNTFNIPVLVGTTETTLGRHIFKQLFPDDFKIENKQIKKKGLNKIFTQLRDQYDITKASDIIVEIQKLVFRVHSTIGYSLFLELFTVEDELKQLKEQLRKTEDILKQQEIIQKIEDKLKVVIKERFPDFYDYVESGAAKGWGQVKALLGVKGVAADVTGKTYLVDNSIAEGFSPIQFFKGGSPARKGLMDRAVNTAGTGYLTRKLIYSMASVRLSKTRDCKTKNYLKIKVTKDFLSRLDGRYYLKESTITEVKDRDDIKNLTIQLRSPIYCKSEDGICHTCFGHLMDQIKTEDIGILTGQTIGERGTQLIMKCSDGLVHYNNQLWAFEDFFDYFNIPVTIVDWKATKDISHLNIYVDGKDGPVKALRVQKHVPKEQLYFISTKSGQNLIVQGNHPLWIKKNQIDEIGNIDNKRFRLVDDNMYKVTGSARKPHGITDYELKEVEARYINKYDAIWIDTTIASQNKNSIIPEYGGYLCGIYFAEGCKIGATTNSWDKGNLISQNTEGSIKEKIFEEANIYFDKVKHWSQGIFFQDKQWKINNIVLGDRCYNKRLPTNFIDFDKEWLKDFLSGEIDGDGSVFHNSATTCRIYTSSPYFMQQLKAICLKLGYKMNTCLVPYTDTGKNEVQKRINFQCDISFLENPYLNSIKFKRVEFIPVKQRRELAIKGFDIISNITPMWWWEYPVYDVQTETSEYNLSCVQNHNTFHCLLDNSICYVRIKNKAYVMSLKEIWQHYKPNKININNENEEKIIDDLQVWDNGSWTNVSKIIRHKKNPDTSIVMTRSKSGSFIIAQDNHPHMFAKNKCVCDDCGLPLTKSKKLNINPNQFECPKCHKAKHRVKQESDNSFQMVQPKEFIKRKYFSSLSFPIWQEAKVETLIDAYLLGMYIAEGSINYYKGKARGWTISQHDEGLVKERIKVLMESFGHISISDNKTFTSYKPDFAKVMMDRCGRYSWEKKLPMDFIYYSDEDLKDILCGVIDGDGHLHTSTDRTGIQIEITSCQFIQQLHHILNKFNLYHNITVGCIRKLTRHQTYIVKVYPTKEHKEIFKNSFKLKDVNWQDKISRNRYPELVDYNKEIMFDDDNYVYDLTTESHTLTVNGMWTHNTGGAVSMSVLNFAEQLAKTNLELNQSELEEVFDQDNEIITLKQDIELVIDTVDYEKKDMMRVIQEDGTTIYALNYLNARLHSDTINEDLFFNSKIVIKYSDKEIDENKITIKLNKGDIIKLDITSAGMDDKVKVLLNLIEKKNKITDPFHLLNELFEVYKDATSSDLVHFELIVSQIMRNKNDLKKPARLVEPYDATCVGLKTLPYFDSWLNGLLFENAGKALELGLIEGADGENSLTKLFMGEDV